MTRAQADPEAYKKAKSRLPAPDGEHCVICGAPLPAGKQRYCSDACFNSYFTMRLPWRWNKVRTKVFTRDDYTCQHCGQQLHYSQLEADHKLPVSLGGEEFSLDNLQTLCGPCHEEKTKRDLKLLRAFNLEVLQRRQKKRWASWLKD